MAHSPIIKSSKWKPVRFLTQRCVLGGFISTPIKVDEETHPVTKQLFVRMRGTDKWMLKVLGSKLNGEQRHKKFLDMLQKKSQNATVVPHTDYGDGLDDKMTALDWEYDDVGEGDPPGTAQQQDEARSNKNAKQTIPTNSIIKLDMPQTHPAAGASGDGPMRQVSVRHRGSHSGRCLWLAEDDVEWALEYMWTELETCGVLPIPDDEQGEDSPPTDSLSAHGDEPLFPESQIRWDFTAGGWKFLDGKGNQRFCKVTDFPKGCTDLTEAEFADLRYEEKKRLTYDYACEQARSR